MTTITYTTAREHDLWWYENETYIVLDEHAEYDVLRYKESMHVTIFYFLDIWNTQKTCREIKQLYP